MRLSVIIPARNEERRLPPTLEAVAAHLPTLGVDAEVIVVDAGSTDTTATVAASFAEKIPSLRVIPAADTGARCNKGLAVKTGMLAATGDLRCFIDADNGAPFDQIGALLSLAANHDVVIGSRYIPGGDPGKRTVVRTIVSRGGNLIFRAGLGVRQKDTHCPLKLFTASSAELLFGLSRIDGLGFDEEVLAIAANRGLRIAEVPVRWRAIGGSKVRLHTVAESFAEVGQIRRNFRAGLYDGEPGA